MDGELLDRPAATRTIEITTTGRGRGGSVRIEIWWFRFEDRFVITGTPGSRDWLANVQADPQMIIHAVGRDLPASALLVADRSFRRRFFGQSNAEIHWYLSEA